MNMSRYNIAKREEMIKKLEVSINERRLKHSFGVEAAAKALAKQHGVDERKAAIAGLLHDCAKRADEEVLALAKTYGISTHIGAPDFALLHAPLGAFVARHEYGITDTDILDAICSHTVGREGMSALEKIIYIADWIEINRGSDPDIEALRVLAKKDLDEAVMMGMRLSIRMVKEKGKAIDPSTALALEFMEREYKDKQKGEDSLKETEIKGMVEAICKSLYDHKADDIIILETSNLTIVADYFIVCGANSSTHVRTLADETEDAMKLMDQLPLRVEGYNAGKWIVMDYGSVLVHIFHHEEREYYNLERLWMDGQNCRYYSEEMKNAAPTNL